MNLNKEEREDIVIGNKIDDENLLINLSYKDFIVLCMMFTDKFVIPFSQTNFPKEDLNFSNLFIHGLISKEELEKRRIDAWNRYDKLEGVDKAVQRITVCFLYPDITSKDNDYIDDFQELFLNLLLDVKNGLCSQFFNFLTTHFKSR